MLIHSLQILSISFKYQNYNVQLEFLFLYLPVSLPLATLPEATLLPKLSRRITGLAMQIDGRFEYSLRKLKIYSKQDNHEYINNKCSTV